MTGTKNYDSEFCGRLPLHQINLIQDYGYLIVLQKPDLKIIQISENVEQLLGIQSDAIVGASFTSFADEKLLSLLKLKAEGSITHKIPVTFSLQTKKAPVEIIALLHTKQDHLILELEKASGKQKTSFIDLYEQVSYVTAELQSAKTPVDVCTIAVKELKRISGFEKVMIYQFDEHWNGTVIAEEGIDALPKYLGLKFPASDVPKQARELYLKNPYRLIPNRKYTPIRLYPVINPLSQGFIDLSECNLRGVAAVHLEYLGNMGATASMSIRILKDGKLWGLIACHHRQASYLDYEQCSVLEMISNFVSEKIATLLNKESFDLTSGTRETKSKIMDRIYSANDIVEGLSDDENNLLTLFNATGAAVVVNRSVSLFGKTPDKEEVESIIYWLQSKNNQIVFADSSFSNVYEHASDYSDRASGIIAIPLREDKGDYILVFRPEVIQTVNWGGNPDDAIQFEPDKKNYHPRNSFEKWKQTLKKTAVPWKDYELAAAEELRSSIFEFSTRTLLN